MIKVISNLLKKEMFEPKTIYALRGFNSIINKLEIELEHIFDTGIVEDLLNIQKSNPQKLIKENIQKLDTNNSFFCLYEELVFIEKNSLYGLISEFKKKVIDIGCFDYYYPGLLSTSMLEVYEIFEQDLELDNIQKLYTSYTLRDGNSIIAYNDLDDQKSIEYFNLFKSYSQTFTYQRIDNIQSVDLYDNCSPEILIQIFNGVFLNQYNTVVYHAVEGKDNKFLKKYLYILNLGGVNIINEYSVKENIKPELYNEYLSILKRINFNYEFYDIKIYEDPFTSNKKIDLNQSIIIDTIYSNLVAAQEKNCFRDIFVTAPTGAGKSVLFQIPAILGAEKKNLMTIIISPLIGLMKDQVSNLKKLTNCAATINSEFTPFEKDSIKEKIKNGEISILYISPETLLSNADIETFIGDRKIGLMVIDEAHTVATWGKNFRPDYWYLGDYINKLRNNSRYVFPIATFTATATISCGNEDMYHDIIESLNMTPITFFGDIKRSNINFNIKSHKVNHAYAEEKDYVVNNTINEYINSAEKTLVYFPYVSILEDTFKAFSEKGVALYYGDLDKYKKDESLSEFKSGNINVIFATKAFGMGIDIKDIKNVYHFAPTGNLSDYVQEIGRIARDPKMVGIASTDYYENDFRYINQLYGMSQITNYNIKGVLQKIDYKYKKAGKRNFLVSVNDFSHIFNAKDENEIECKLKATIIAIKKDFRSMSNYVPLIFKPRGMFTKGLFFIPDEKLNQVKSYGWEKYLTKIYDRNYLDRISTNGLTHKYLGDIYEFNFKDCWEENYNGKFNGVSFGNFKRMFYEDELPNIERKNCLFDRMVLTIESKNGFTFETSVNRFINFIKNFKLLLDDMKILNKHYNVYEIAQMYYEKYNKNLSLSKLKNIMEPLINLLISYNANLSFGKNKFCEYYSNKDKYYIVSQNYDRVIKKLIEAIKFHFNKFMNETIRISIVESDFSGKNKQMRNDPLLIAIQIMEMLELSNYSFQSGDKPEFFVRVNSEKLILSVIENKFYNSRTLSAIKQLHIDSVSYMKYFFEKLSSDEERWQFVEDYFLGRIDSKYQIKKINKIGIKTIDEPIIEMPLKSIKDISVYSVFHNEDSQSEKYYISDAEIPELISYIRISQDCLVAKNLKEHKVGDVFVVNDYEYLIEKIEVFETKQNIY